MLVLTVHKSLLNKIATEDNANWCGILTSHIKCPRVPKQNIYNANEESIPFQTKLLGLPLAAVYIERKVSSEGSAETWFF